MRKLKKYNIKGRKFFEYCTVLSRSAGTDFPKECIYINTNTNTLINIKVTKLGFHFYIKTTTTKSDRTRYLGILTSSHYFLKYDAL